MQLSDDFLDRWERIIAEVHKTDIPLECIKKVIIKLVGGRQKTVNLHNLRRQGVAVEELEVIINRTLKDMDHEIRDVDFVVDPEAVANIVQPETDRILEKFKK